jgi:hypothetical protein
VAQSSDGYDLEGHAFNASCRMERQKMKNKKILDAKSDVGSEGRDRAIGTDDES